MASTDPLEQIIDQLCNPGSTDPHRHALLDLFVHMRDERDRALGLPAIGDLA